MRSIYLALPASMALLLSNFAPSTLLAADAPPATSKPSVAGRPAANADTKQPNNATLYDLPKGDDSKQYIEFIQRIAGFQPNTEAEERDYNAKAQPAVEAAAQKILTLEKDPQSVLAKQARMILLNIRINHVETLDAKQQQELVDTVLKSLSEKGGLEQNNLRLAMSLATSLEYGGNPPLAAEAYAGLGKALSGSDNENFREMAKKFEGAHRRLTSIGKPLEITGATVDGKPFDWAKYRGKVVLVDFWATWCGPCLAEMPNVRKNYDKYHAQGFDVVGVSIDEDHDALVAFLAKANPPWANLQDGVNADPTKSSLADHYGIFGIPATFLIDKEGNVISTQARGETLGPQIEKALAAGKKTTGK